MPLSGCFDSLIEGLEGTEDVFGLLRLGDKRSLAGLAFQPSFVHKLVQRVADGRAADSVGLLQLKLRRNLRADGVDAFFEYRGEEWSLAESKAEWAWNDPM